MSTEDTSTKSVFIRQKIVAEDIEIGFDNVVQIRHGKRVSGHRLNAFNIPYDDKRSIGDVLKQLLETSGG